jgi:hypothetical protein
MGPEPVSKREREPLESTYRIASERRSRRSERVREGGVEPPRPCGHRILRLLALVRDPVPRVVPCRLVSTYVAAGRSVVSRS